MESVEHIYKEMANSFHSVSLSTPKLKLRVIWKKRGN